MPSKSRHSQRKKSFKTSNKARQDSPAAAASTPVAGAPYQSTPTLRTVSTAGKAATATAMQYPFVKKELMWIGILAAIIIIALVVLRLVL